MTRIVHISDIHWRGLSRHDEYKKAFNLLYTELRNLSPAPDLIINTGDVFHTKTQGITPEVIQELANMYNELADIAPVYTLLGNHDGALTNKTRMDLISSIHNLINNPNAILFKKSGTYKLDHLQRKIAFHAFSVFDKGSWAEIKPLKGYINIALYHGSVTGCEMDNSWRLPSGEQQTTFFKPFDFCFLGDIHKFQFLDTRKDKNGEEKPWIGYPGSLLQQNFGEDIKKGYLIWDIEDKNDWNVNWKQLINMAPFVTLPWLGTVEKTLDSYAKLHGSFAYMPGTRYRITSNTYIPQIQSRKLIKELTTEHDAREVTFKTDVISRMDSITTEGLKLNKKSLIQDPDAMIKLYRKFISKHPESYQFTDKQIEDASQTIKNYLHTLLKNSENISARNVTWSIKEFWWDNLYGYNEGNYINFENLENLVGIFGRNRAGKSSIIGGLMYVLWNTTDRGPVKNNHIINDLKGYCSGKVRFSVGTTDYIVERRTERVFKNKKESSATEVKFWKIRNDGCQEVQLENNGISRDDTDAKIRKLIGTSEDFLLTSFANQGKLNKFIDNKATKRKEFLNRFLELDIFDKLFSLAKDDYSKLNNKNEDYSLEEWTKNIEKTKLIVQKIEADISALDLKQKALNEKRDKLNVWVKSHEKNASEIEISSFKNLKTHIDDAENNIKNVTERLKLNKVDLRKSNTKSRLLKRKKDKLDISGLKSDLILMEKVENSISLLKTTLELESKELDLQKNSIVKLKLAPCGKQFPTCHFIKDGHKAKETIQAQKELVKRITREFSDNQKILKKYASQQIKNKIKEYNDLEMEIKINVTHIKNLEDKIENDENYLVSLKKDLRSSKTKLKKAEKTVNVLAGEEFKKKVDNLSKMEDNVDALLKEKGGLLINLGANKQKLERLLAEQELNKDLIAKLTICESIQTAFSKNGIPAMILMTQLPAINREMLGIIGNLVDFTVTLETDVTSNIMDIYIEDGKSRRLVEMGSGMEKTICSLALRVALGNLSSLARPDIFILDESFGALDEDNLPKGMELLSMFKGYFKSIFVITHISQIKEIADSIIEINNDGISSTIDVQ